MSHETTSNISGSDAGNGSTGPRTEQGKKRSSLNSLKHGFTAADLHLAEHEREEFEEFKTSLVREIQPIGTVQMVFFNAFLLASWNLLRIARLDTEYLAKGSEAFKDPDTRKALELLGRYQARHERALYRARKELEQLHTAEVVTQLLPEEVQQVTPRMANPMKIHIAKRTASKAWNEDNKDWMTAFPGVSDIGGQPAGG